MSPLGAVRRPGRRARRPPRAPRTHHMARLLVLASRLAQFVLDFSTVLLADSLAWQPLSLHTAHARWRRVCSQRDVPYRWFFIHYLHMSDSVQTLGALTYFDPGAGTGEGAGGPLLTPRHVKTGLPGLCSPPHACVRMPDSADCQSVGGAWCAHTASVVPREATRI